MTAELQRRAPSSAPQGTDEAESAYWRPPAGASRPEISVVFRDPGNRVDAIRDYTHLLADGLRQSGASAGVALLQGPAVPAPPPGTKVVVVNYNPFSWGRWGWAPTLPGSLVRLRARPLRPLIATMVHEGAVPWGGVRRTLMGAWQRAQLAAMLRVADIVCVSIEPWIPWLRRFAGPSKSIHHLPVGSNVPDMRCAREGERARLGIDPDALVLGLFGGRHPSRPIEHLREAIIATSRRHRRLVVLNLGADAPALSGLDSSVEIITPGPLPPAALASTLSAADIFAAPYTDGASSRRGTLATGFQHALPIVSTLGPLTDPFLVRSDALTLVPARDSQAFGKAVADLADDAELRLALGARARQLFDERLDWQSIARRLLGLLAAARGTAPSGQGETRSVG